MPYRSPGSSDGRWFGNHTNQPNAAAAATATTTPPATHGHRRRRVRGSFTGAGAGAGSEVAAVSGRFPCPEYGGLQAQPRVDPENPTAGRENLHTMSLRLDDPIESIDARIANRQMGV